MNEIKTYKTGVRMKADKGNILVTGGAGYIGSHVVRDLGEKGYFPVVYDDLSTGNQQHVLYGDFIKGNVGDQNLVEEIIKKYNIKNVIHFAASIVVEESVTNPFKYYQNNSMNSFNLIKTCVQNGIENFVFSSTAAVYGIPREIPVNEKGILNPINPYGKSKLVTEMLLKDVANTYDNFNYVALRYFNVAGADKNCRIGQNYKKATHLITLALKAAHGEYDKLNVFGTDYTTPDGTAVRDYIHIDDLATAHLLALEYLKKENKSVVLNCGYGQGSSVLDVIKSVKNVTGIDFPVINSERRAGDPAQLVADSSLIYDILGWRPKFNNLDYIVQTAWNWEKKVVNKNNKS